MDVLSFHQQLRSQVDDLLARKLGASPQELATTLDTIAYIMCQMPQDTGTHVGTEAHALAEAVDVETLSEALLRHYPFLGLYERTQDFAMELGNEISWVGGALDDLRRVVQAMLDIDRMLCEQSPREALKYARWSYRTKWQGNLRELQRILWNIIKERTTPIHGLRRVPPQK